MSINAFRSYFHVDLGGATEVRQFVMNLEETTGIVSMEDERCKM